ncbi:MAG TPA: AAA family ATPase [Conexibacter sp.]|jgi:exonuclease SbcC|nr:AAA family ATPase [Conexibacter sp.]
MTTPHLDAITIANFRGIGGPLAVPLAAPVVLIHGTNGAGKSTVMSAIELALTGQVAGVAQGESEHLLHRGAEHGRIELHTADQAAGFDLDGHTIRGKPLLNRTDASFFTERCYLAQRTLGRLLEMYERPNATGDSALSLFVKELTGLDELDALIEGLYPVGHKRRVQQLVPEYKDAERELEVQQQRQRSLQDELDQNAQHLETVRSKLREQLASLDAPPLLTRDLDAASHWLERSDVDSVLVELVGARRELLAIARRASEVAESANAKEIAALAAAATTARSAADAWRDSYGRALEELLDAARRDLALVPAAGTADPEAIRTTALHAVRTEVDRLSAVIAADDHAHREATRLDAAIEGAQARVTLVDAQLAASGTATASEELGKVLAALIPHVHSDDCPVCGRHFSEVTREPLSAHLATRVSELAERADRLQALAKARLDALADLRRLQDERRALGDQRLKASVKLQAQAAVARLEDAHRRLVELAPGIAEGATVIRRATAAERDLGLARERDRASAELRVSLTELGAKLGYSPDNGASLADAVNVLSQGVAKQIGLLETRAATRGSAQRTLAEVARGEARQQELEAAIAQVSASAKRIAASIGELGRRRDIMKEVRKQAEAARYTIIRQVFTRSLNRVWRDLFVRLVPEEPFVPVFRVPDSARDRVVARLETLHRDGKPGGTPATMLSAGNLNTAALTLFLALNLSVERRLPWILLDDPVQSMDEVHVSQFAALLRTLSKQHGRRIVIAVHERALFDYLALELSPASPDDLLITVELNRSPEGVTLVRPGFTQYEEDRAFALA